MPGDEVTMKRPLLMIVSMLLAAAPGRAFERVYSLGDKIDGSRLIVLAKVAEVRELAPAKRPAGEQVVGDYLYRLEVRDVLKGVGKPREVIVIHSPEFRSDKRCYLPDSLVIAFLNPNGLSDRFLRAYRLGRRPYHRNFAQRQGTLVVGDSTAPLHAEAIRRYLAAKQAKPRQRPAKWAALLDLDVPELKESALSELTAAPYYPARDAFITCLADENLTSYACKNLALLSPDSLYDRLDMLLLLSRTDSRRVRVNLLKLVAPLRDDRVFKLLQKSLKDEQFEVRATAAKGLEHWNDKKAVKSLKKALGDEDDFVRNAAYEALTKQGFKIEQKDDGYYRIISEPTVKDIPWLK
jgi:hypothetical protein